MAEQAVQVFTDGGSVPNPGPGAWGALLISHGTAQYLSGYESDPKTTNNKMELSAAINALRAFTKGARIEMHTDSKYVKDGIESWLPKWKKNKWLTSKKEPVKNQDLWLELERQLETHEVSWGWVRAHADNRYNNFVDWLVFDAIQNQRGTSKRVSVDELDKFIDTLKLRIKR